MRNDEIVEKVVKWVCARLSVTNTHLQSETRISHNEMRRAKTLIYMSLWRVIPCRLDQLPDYWRCPYDIQEAVFYHHRYLDSEPEYRAMFDELESFAVHLKRLT